jgi:transcriptional regulator with XRE-family HTH domain
MTHLTADPALQPRLAPIQPTRDHYAGIGARIRTARVAADASQQQLAEAIGFSSQVAISHIERGERAISVHHLFAISIALDVAIIDLLGVRP